jgi:hypothetical protein
MQSSGKYKAYLLLGCPFCFKFLLFMTEAGLLDQIEIVKVDPQDAGYEALKSKISESTGAKATFPTVEIEPGVFKSDTASLIEYFAQKNNVTTDLPVVSFYTEGLFARYVEMYKENLALKQQVKGAG